MIHANTGRRVVLVGLLAMIAALLPLTAASAAHLTGVTQLTAADGDGANVDAAIAWSNPAAHPSGGLASGARDPQYVLIGRADIFPDNLASGALQTDGSGPLLLTDTDALDEAVVEEIARLGVDDAIILGNTEAISQAVEDQLNELLGGQIRREGGPTRIETAIEVTEASGATTALLARAYDTQGGDSSQAFADSLAAGAWAAEDGYGVLLTEGHALTASVAEHLSGGDVEEVIIVGGTDAISDDVENQVSAIDGVTVRRVGGANRAGTAVAIAAERGVSQVDSSTDGVILVEGYLENAWASGFPAAATSALEGEAAGYPVVLSSGEGLPPETEAFADGDVMTTALNSTTDLVCGPLLPGAGDDGPDDDNVTEDRAPACEQFADAAVIRTVHSGTITAVDTDADTFDFETAPDTGADAEVEVTTRGYGEEDSFSVDGEDASLEEFEESITAGDEVTVTDTIDALDVDLSNVGGRATGPRMLQARGQINITGLTEDFVDVGYDRPMADCADFTPSQFTYTDSDSDAVPAVRIECERADDQLTIRFEFGTLDSEGEDGTLAYTASEQASEQVADQNGDPARTPDTVTVDCCDSVL